MLTAMVLDVPKKKMSPQAKRDWLADLIYTHKLCQLYCCAEWQHVHFGLGQGQANMLAYDKGLKEAETMLEKALPLKCVYDPEKLHSRKGNKQKVMGKEIASLGGSASKASPTF